MMNAYFGDNTDPARGEIWAEIQWTAWLLDGGVPLIVAYAIALVSAVLIAWRLARSRTLGEKSELWILAALILAYNVGACALTFSYPLFVGTMGLQFWVLNATLYAAGVTTFAELRRPSAGTSGRAEALTGQPT
jgi:hypothetical protein